MTTMPLRWNQISMMDLLCLVTVSGIACWAAIYLVAEPLKKADYFREPPSFREVKIKRNQEQVRKLRELQNAKP